MEWEQLNGDALRILYLDTEFNIVCYIYVSDLIDFEMLLQMEWELQNGELQRVLPITKEGTTFLV